MKLLPGWKGKIKKEISERRAPCVKCLWRLGFTQREISSKLKMWKPRVTAITKETGVSWPKCIRGNKARSRKMNSQNRKLLNSLFRRTVLKIRREQIAAFRPHRIKKDKAKQLAKYYANHEVNKRKSADRAMAHYYATKGDPYWTMKRCMRNILGRLTRVYKVEKLKRTNEYLGCTVMQARAYIESQFKRGMTWANHGSVWHIDHRIPLASFDLTSEREVLLASHFTNLQPLYVKHNIAKGDKLEKHEQLPMLINA